MRKAAKGSEEHCLCGDEKTKGRMSLWRQEFRGEEWRAKGAVGGGACLNGALGLLAGISTNEIKVHKQLLCWFPKLESFSHSPFKTTYAATLNGNMV